MFSHAALVEVKCMWKRLHRVGQRRFFSGNPRYIPSNAWIWLFSWREQISACSEGFRYKPTMSSKFLEVSRQSWGWGSQVLNGCGCLYTGFIAWTKAADPGHRNYANECD